MKCGSYPDGWKRVLLCIIALAVLCSKMGSSATDIKWTPGDNSDPAHNAPRSQRYWDEHNIQRPDYAKTDAEIAAERGVISRKPAFLSIFLVVGLMAGLVAGYHVKYNLFETGGTRLGGEKASPVEQLLAFLGVGVPSTGWSSNEAAEKAREARLARFEAPKAD